MSHRAFISYASQNQSMADSTYQHLKRCGVTCWMAPHDIPPAESWMKAIMQAIKSCDVVVLLLCSHANESKFVLREVERAAHYNKKILTVKLENLVPCDDLEFLLSLHQWLDAYATSLDRVPPRIVESLAELGKSAPNIAPPNDDPLDSMPLQELVAEGLELVAEEIGSLQSLETPVRPRDIGRVLDMAIHYGAPAYNRGSITGCAEIYFTTANSLSETVAFESLPGDVPWLVPLERFGSQLEDIRSGYPLIETATAREVAWALRHVFDRFHTARGIQEIHDIMDHIQETHAPLQRDLILLPVLVAIQHGNQVFAANDLHGCAELHHFTAQRLCQYLETGSSKSSLRNDPQLLAFHHQLQKILAAHPEVDPANSEELAWELYQTFMSLLKAT